MAGWMVSRCGRGTLPRWCWLALPLGRRAVAGLQRRADGWYACALGRDDHHGAIACAQDEPRPPDWGCIRFGLEVLVHHPPLGVVVAERRNVPVEHGMVTRLGAHPSRQSEVFRGITLEVRCEVGIVFVEHSGMA
jgi:hypothetical protein